MRASNRDWVRALERTATIGRDPTRTLPILVGELAERYGEAPALIGGPPGTGGRVVLSYRALAAVSNRYARWGLSRNFGRGDVVCLLMMNCPEYLAIWLGLTRIGITVALINTNLTGELLAHSLAIVAPRAVIVGASLAGALAGVRATLAGRVECWLQGAGETRGVLWLEPELARLPGEALAPTECPPPALTERALYIYTSGTTGRPKAANVSHLRLMQWSHWFAGLIDAGRGDRMYNCLPMYHSVGGVVATGATLVGGGVVVVRERFSAGSFWKDVVEERCTLFQYIGELCRYLVNSPHQSHETQHQLRLACGNGLRADVWVAFKERFRIPRILEYYAATEGNFSLYNTEGRTGSLGRVPPFLAHRLPVALVKYDVESGAPARNAGGRCVRCGVNEVGEALGEILDEGGATRFEGYADAAASGAKVLRDVFTEGDAWYRTGDLMRRDEQGFFYFVDRVGDTFRWKGENVSTTEVAAVIGHCPGVLDAAVYGVSVPDADGRAGMAALSVSADFDLAELRRRLAAALPSYARPVFVRILTALELTGTFKHRTQELAREGYDPGGITDALYLDDPESGQYLRLDQPLYQRLVAGDVRL